MKKLLLFFFVFLPLFSTAAVTAVFVTGIDELPLATNSETPDARSLSRGSVLLKEYRQSLLRPDALTTLTISERDFNQMLLLAGRGIGKASFEARMLSTGLLVTASVRVPKTPLGRYFNAWIAIEPSEGGVRIDAARLGKLDIPNWAALAIVRYGLDAALGKGGGEEALASIRKIAFSPQRMSVTYRPVPVLMSKLEASARETYRGYAVKIDPAAVRVYYTALVETSHSFAKSRVASFTEFFGPVMALAKHRSVSADAAEENRAAILALAIYFGDDRFERIIGDVRTGELAGSRPDTEHVTLRGRHDLVQHFTISAALAVLAGMGVADIVGEIKEVQDTGTGGSGFSFTDIAADRAGTRFAEASTGARTSVWVQKLLAGAPLESMFFPSIAGLPEFMSEGDFSRRFGAVGSPEYDRVLRDIDQRLSRLAVFGGS